MVELNNKIPGSIRNYQKAHPVWQADDEMNYGSARSWRGSSHWVKEVWLAGRPCSVLPCTTFPGWVLSRRHVPTVRCTKIINWWRVSSHETLTCMVLWVSEPKDSLRISVRCPPLRPTTDFMFLFRVFYHSSSCAEYRLCLLTQCKEIRD